MAGRRISPEKALICPVCGKSWLQVCRERGRKIKTRRYWEKFLIILSHIRKEHPEEYKKIKELARKGDLKRTYYVNHTYFNRVRSIYWTCPICGYTMRVHGYNDIHHILTEHPDVVKSIISEKDLKRR